MKLYAESSAVLAWLLGEPAGQTARAILDSAEMVVSSELTLIECDRVLVRAVALGALAEGAAADRRGTLNNVAASWHIFRLGQEIVERARRPFPEEPIRTLDAIHLASALFAKSALSGLEVLSFDKRLRSAAASLGMPLQPAALDALPSGPAA